MKYSTNEIYMMLEFMAEQISEINDNVRVLINRSLSGKDRSTESEVSIDYGKVKALRKAGWSYSKIAEEMGCSKSAVAAIIRKEALKNERV